MAQPLHLWAKAAPFSCNFSTLYFAMSRLHFEKNQKFLRQRVSPWAFLGLYKLIINKLYRVKPHQKGFTLTTVKFHILIYWLSIDYNQQNMGETLIWKRWNPLRGGFTHHYILTFKILGHKNRGGETLPLKNFRKKSSCNLNITKIADSSTKIQK